MLRKLLVYIICILVLAVPVYFCSCSDGGNKEVNAKMHIPQPPETRFSEVTVSAMGDMLMHMPVVYSVKDSDTGRYKFANIFAPVQGIIRNADYSLANLETRMAGEEYGYSGFPRFNCPADLAGGMNKCGLDMFLTANNHSMDKGVAGIVNTLDNIESAGMDYIGTYAGESDKEPFLKEINSVQVGFMNYTSSTNGLPVPEDKPYLVNMIDRDEMLEEVNALEESGADIIICNLHFGVEYSHVPGEKQKELVDFLFEKGVDIVLGSHPHVVQPFETRKVQEDGMEKKKFAAYSLGNFVSNQRWDNTDTGLLVNLTIKKNLDSGETVLDNVQAVPTWVDMYYDNNKKKYRVIPVHRYIKKYEEDNAPLITENDYRRLKQVSAEFDGEFFNIRDTSWVEIN